MCCCVTPEGHSRCVVVSVTPEGHSRCVVVSVTPEGHSRCVVVLHQRVTLDVYVVSVDTRGSL